MVHTQEGDITNAKEKRGRKISRVSKIPLLNVRCGRLGDLFRHEQIDERRANPGPFATRTHGRERGIDIGPRVIRAN